MSALRLAPALTVPCLRRALALACAFCALSLGALLAAGSARAGSYWVYACGQYGNAVWGPSANTGAVRPSSHCPGSGLLVLSTGARVGAGAYARWAATAPGGLAITQISVPGYQLAVNEINQRRSGYGGGFFWAGGGQGVNHTETSYSSPRFSSPYVGFQVICGDASCAIGDASIQAGSIGLLVGEGNGPSVTADGSDNLWYRQGWARGSWPISFSASDPSGICGTQAVIDGQGLPGPAASPNPTVWQQCPQLTDTQAINTGLYPDGAMTLLYSARNAAGNVSSPAKTAYVDNATPTVALSPTRDVASSTGATQYVAANASAGPSGVAGMACSVDGVGQFYPGASAQIPVAGLGQHAITCVAANNALDVNGNPGTSAPASTTLSIRQPTADAISFGSRTLDALRCRRVTERIKVPGRVVTVRRRRHHKVVLVKIRRPGHLKTIRVRRCRPRTKTVIVRIHGHKHRERVVVLPHTIQLTTIRVRYGHSATISGWVGSTAGVPLPGQPVSIVTAPDNGSNAFTQAAAVTSAANGTWSAKLAPGPSRIAQANYGGSGASEPSSSGLVHLIVPASVKLLSVSPTRVAWGGTVRLTGQLLGGYLPAAGALVRLRIGQGSSRLTYGVKTHVTGDGRFTTSYTFGAGQASNRQSFYFEIESLPVGDYPYAPASSRRVSVLVGGHPAGTQHAPERPASKPKRPGRPYPVHKRHPPHKRHATHKRSSSPIRKHPAAKNEHGQR